MIAAKEKRKYVKISWCMFIIVAFISIFGFIASANANSNVYDITLFNDKKGIFAQKYGMGAIINGHGS